jgi:ATP-dependent DNA ligase
MFMAFDCLLLSEKDLCNHRLGVRWDILDRLLDSQTFLLPARHLASHGLEAWEQVVTEGYEGLVAKDPASNYVGGRTLQWLKVKQSEYRIEERGWSQDVDRPSKRR